MPQTTLSVVVEVLPASAELLRDRIKSLREREEATPTPADQRYDHIRSAVPVLHFMSLTVFRDDQYDPVFVIEANFDGQRGSFWRQLEAAIGPELRDMLRCCKPPQDASARIFDEVTRPESRAALAPFLEARTVGPLVRHQGNRGLDRARILAEGKLFAAVQQELNGGQYANLPAKGVQQRLRAVLRPQFAWLDRSLPHRISAAENAWDWIQLLVFVALGLVSLAAPWWIVALALDSRLPRWPGWWALALAVPAAIASLLCLVAWLRWLERRDSAADDPPLDAEAMRLMAEHEDHIAQNHMISIVHVKPGVLRAVLLRAGLRALGLYLRVAARDGYLNSMRTIHFAHWALISNGSRLMFHSNYDGSWESYLDDFIEKAHAGLTFAWTSAIGFPPTQYMFREGATNGRLFKAWGRHSMCESQFWFSAYREYSVNQIERQARVAAGLRKSTLTESEARAWALDL